jgi:cellobiose phosphorylase
MDSLNYHFDDDNRSFVLNEHTLPNPWINYLGNRRLSAFISHNAGGVLWLLEPYSRRITRYHYTAAPGDRPGFYIYIRDRKTGNIWNPHFAPCCTELDSFQCSHEPGITSFTAVKDGVRIDLKYGISQSDDVMVWDVKVSNTSKEDISIQVVSFLEFGLLEFLREALGWCYLKNQFSLGFDRSCSAIKYDYHVFEAPDCPSMAFACTGDISGYDCSRNAFLGITGHYGAPESLQPGHELSNSELPDGGHACGTLGVDVRLEPSESKEFSFLFVIADKPEKVDALTGKYRSRAVINSVFSEIRRFWNDRLGGFHAATGNSNMDSFVNTWNPFNAMTALQHCRIISTDHMGTDGLRFRDSMQDALAIANIDPEFAEGKILEILREQRNDGSGCMSFFPNTQRKTTELPHRSDNPVWMAHSIENLIAETGNVSFLDKVVPFRDGGDATIYGHILAGLKSIYMNRGRNGLPLLFHADWNDGLALFEDEKAESVMLGMQLVFACRKLHEMAKIKGKSDDAEWCCSAMGEITEILNSDLAWDGQWYKRLILSNGKPVGSASNKQGRIYLEPQVWAVMSGVADVDRGILAMDSVSKHLDTDCGIRLVSPSFRGFPEPGDPPKGSNPGIGENGGIFCHANTWAIIAECILGNGERAFKYYKQLMPENIISKYGASHYGREPYVYVSSIVGPDSGNFGRAGISWLTGTASWMYVAVTQFILGIRPELHGLFINPCLPDELQEIKIKRMFRNEEYNITVVRESSGIQPQSRNSKPHKGQLVKPSGENVTEIKIVL